jgi:hypothetical protein
MRKGTTPTQDVPSNSWISTDGGTSARNAAAGTGQCANSRSSQLWRIRHGPRGNGQGR